MKKGLLVSVVMLLSICFSCLSTVGAGAKIKMPSSVLDLSKDNTYPNPTQDLPHLEPSELAKQLLSTASIKIENPNLIRLMNESSIANTKVAIGYKATIFLGQWALNYDSNETTVNWEYQKINTNKLDNRGGNAPGQMHYVQEQQKRVKGGLTAYIPNAEDVKKMVLMEAMKKTNLPLSFETVIGQGTKKEQVYNIPTRKIGYLNAYTPAVNEKGKVTYGEVYLVLKGHSQKIVIKNVVSQGIGAWIPVQDHASFSYGVYETPR
ncbi:YfkD family protein [Metabacillus sp. RGM 3146]|uniref:YfkD famly protein n=1 Tax=Metabacillus sp. RGM 3146 TaxID=3401092 RepID=UPI003B9AD2B5